MGGIGFDPLLGQLTRSSGGAAGLGIQLFNVKSYGAAGDGSADDTTEIQSALDAAHAAGGGLVFIPAGIYLISAILQIYSNTIVYDAGPKSVIKIASLTRPARINGMLKATDQANITIRDLKIDGNLSGNGPTTGVQFENCIYIEGSKYCLIDHVELTNVYSNPVEIVFSGSNNPEYVSVRNSYIHDHNGDAAVRIRTGIKCTVDNNFMYGGSRVMILTASDNCNVTDNYIRPNKGGLNVDGTEYGDWGVNVTSSTHIIVRGNQVIDCKKRPGTSMARALSSTAPATAISAVT